MNAMMEHKPNTPVVPSSTVEQPQETPTIISTCGHVPPWMISIFKDHVKTMNRWTEARIQLAMIKTQLDWEFESLNQKFSTKFSLKDFLTLNAFELDKAWDRLQNVDEDED